MKRYDISNGDADDFPYVAVMRERADGDYCALADLQAWALRHKATVEKLRHDSLCTVSDGYEGYGCICGKDDALREIEELLK